MSSAASQRYVFKDFPHSSHRLLVNLVGRGSKRVLDVGAATGFLGHALGSRGHTVVGLDVDPEAAAAASAHYASFHVADLSALPRLPEAPFDVIVAGDVLEHLAAPERALVALVDQLGPQGRLLVSVPNVAFIAVRVELLAGRFRYRERGILDRTHLRFYTRRSLRALVRSAGLRVIFLRGVPPPLPVVARAFARWPLRGLYELAALLARVWPGLFAFQFVAEARR